MRTVSVCPKTGLRRGSWTAEEDQLLSSYIKRYGHRNWHELPKHAGLSRCGKSCRLRWLNYLRPNIKRGHFTKEEDDIILSYVENHGSRWSVIAAKLEGRTDNEIKNHWHTHLEKCGKKLAVSKGAKRERVKAEKPSLAENAILPDYQNIQILESCPITPVCTSESDNVIIESSGIENGNNILPDIFVELDESFWNELFSVEDDDMQKTISTFDDLLVPSFCHPMESCDLWSFF